MPFLGKATFSAGPELPELVDDLADVVGIISPSETPLLDHLGDPTRAASSTIHEWIEDTLIPNHDRINQSTFSPDGASATSITVRDGSRFRAGDQVRPDGSSEIIFVNAVVGDVVIVSRGYGATFAQELTDGQLLHIIAGAAVEGDDRPEARFTNRTRRQNATQIFTSSVDVSGTMQATRAHAVGDEIDYQKQARMRELLRDLENAVIVGVQNETTPQGTSSAPRTMRGLLSHITTNAFQPDDGRIPEGDGPNSNGLNEAVLNGALRKIWEGSAGRVDTIVVGGAQKRRINQFIAGARRYTPDDTRVRDSVAIYESDFGTCRVILSRWVPDDAAILLDASRIAVLPLAGRSFHYKPLAATGDAERGQLIGEYTLEVLNEAAHGVIRALAA